MTLLFIIGIILVVMAFLEESELCLLLGVSLLVMFCIVSVLSKDKIDKKDLYKYKVRELEKNTVLTVTDSIGGYEVNDTVWVNMEKRTIDPADSVGMMVIVIKKLN